MLVECTSEGYLPPGKPPQNHSLRNNRDNNVVEELFIMNLCVIEGVSVSPPKYYPMNNDLNIPGNHGMLSGQKWSWPQNALNWSFENLHKYVEVIMISLTLSSIQHNIRILTHRYIQYIPCMWECFFFLFRFAQCIAHSRCRLLATHLPAHPFTLLASHLACVLLVLLLEAVSSTMHMLWKSVSIWLKVGLY